MRKALILAAGRGQRISDTIVDRPKGFLEVGGRPIIERSIELLLSHGVRAITIVTGYAAGSYESLARFVPQIELVHNPGFASSGSMYSFYLAREHLSESFLLLESDLLYESRALDALIDCAEANVVLGSGRTGAGDEVYMECRCGRLVKMSKRPDQLNSIAGELVGISKISSTMLAAMMEFAEQYFKRTSRRLEYEDCINGIADSIEIRTLIIDDLAWCEIDDREHLARAKNVILPRISREKPRCRHLSQEKRERRT